MSADAGRGDGGAGPGGPGPGGAGPGGAGPGELELAAARAYAGFLRRTHLSAPHDLPAVVQEEGRALGAASVLVHLIDYEQAGLRPLLPPGDRSARGALPVEGTVHGRAFATSAVVDVRGGREDQRLLVLPLLDGTDRLGTLEVVVASAGPVAEDWVLVWERYAHMVAQAVVTKSAYGDAIELTRRSRPMDVSAELIWRMMPPLVFGTDDFVVGGLLEPCYANGGDCFDYAVNGRTGHVAIFDAMGHGLAAAGVSSFAISAYRSARRRGLGLAGTYAEMDRALAEQAPGRHVTAVLAELDLESGRLRWVNAGHPPPLLLREGKVVQHALDAQPLTPLGMAFDTGAVVVVERTLQPGDMVLLYTDGLPEARLPDGRFFGVERLAEFVERQASAGYPAPETLRRLRHAVLGHQQGELQDDASAVLLEWRRGSEAQLVPRTV